MAPSQADSGSDANVKSSSIKCTSEKPVCSRTWADYMEQMRWHAVLVTSALTLSVLLMLLVAGSMVIRVITQPMVWAHKVVRRCLRHCATATDVGCSGSSYQPQSQVVDSGVANKDVYVIDDIETGEIRSMARASLRSDLMLLRGRLRLRSVGHVEAGANAVGGCDRCALPSVEACYATTQARCRQWLRAQCLVAAAGGLTWTIRPAA